MTRKIIRGISPSWPLSLKTMRWEKEEKINVFQLCPSHLPYTFSDKEKVRAHAVVKVYYAPVKPGSKPCSIFHGREEMEPHVADSLCQMDNNL